MSELSELLQRHVDVGTLPGAVAVHQHPGGREAVAVGVQDLQTGTPMAPDTLFAVASVTKPITAFAALLLVADGVLAIDDPVTRWLPELADPRVLRDPHGPIEDTVPATRQITVEDLLTLRNGLGFPGDFSGPVMDRLVTDLSEGSPLPHGTEADDWLRAAGRIPLLHQPGEGYSYNTGSALLGLLVGRASGRGLDEFLAERVFEPLGMADARWWVPEGERHRFATRYAPTDDPTRFTVSDPVDGAWAAPPAFPNGAGGLVCTTDDWRRFGTMLLHGGAHEGGRLLPAELVTAMMTNQLSDAQRETAGIFLGGGQGWGYGGSTRTDGSYGWDGGTGTTARVNPRTGQVSILFTQVEMLGPQSTSLVTEFEEFVARQGVGPRS